MVGRGGADAGVDALARILYDLDEENHKYWKIRSMTVAQAKIEKAKLLKERNKAVFNGGQSKPKFITVRRNGRTRVIMVKRRMNFRPSGGNKHRLKSEKRVFSDYGLLDVDVKSKDL